MQFKWPERIPYGALLLLLGAVLFIPFLGNAHLFDWDEINFAESAREMLETGNYLQVQINYQPFSEKPPLFFWMQALSMHLFGVNEMAARLPNALIGMLTLLVLFLIGKRLQNKAFGVVWALLYAASFLPHLYFKSALIDPAFNLFIFLGVYFASVLTQTDEFSPPKLRRAKRRKAVILAGFFIGLAVLTKGPVGVLLFSLAYLFYYFTTRFKKMNSIGELFLFGLVFLFTISSWYGAITLEYGVQFMKGFFLRHIDLATTQDAGHGGPIYYHFIVLLIGCFPASIFVFQAFKQRSETRKEMQVFQRWMIGLLLVVLGVFSLVQTKILHYSSLAYFPITFLGAYSLYFILKGRLKWSWYHALLILLIGIPWAVAALATPLVGMNTEAIIPLLNDPFAEGNLQAQVFWNYGDMVFGGVFLLCLIVVAVLAGFSHYKSSLALLLIACLLFVQSLVIFFVPRIERYTQHAAIEFFTSKRYEECHVAVLGYKSYAPYFYTRRPLLPAEELLANDYELPVYFVTRVDRLEHYTERHPELCEIGRKNGFVFLVKE